jgi:hypothetical protein
MEVNQFGFSGTTFTGIKLQVLKTNLGIKKNGFGPVFLPISFRFANARISILKLKDWLEDNQLGIFRL